MIYEGESTDEPLGPGFFIFFRVDSTSAPERQKRQDYFTQQDSDDDEDELLAMVMVVLRCLK